MRRGDLVCLHWGSCPELECVKPTEWFAQAVNHQKPMIFLEWLPGKDIVEDGWAELVHPDGTRRLVHSDYFARMSK